MNGYIMATRPAIKTQLIVMHISRLDLDTVTDLLLVNTCHYIRANSSIVRMDHGRIQWTIHPDEFNQKVTMVVVKPNRSIVTAQTHCVYYVLDNAFSYMTCPCILYQVMCDQIQKREIGVAFANRIRTNIASRNMRSLHTVVHNAYYSN